MTQKEDFLRKLLELDEDADTSLRFDGKKPSPFAPTQKQPTLPPMDLEPKRGVFEEMEFAPQAPALNPLALFEQMYGSSTKALSNLSSADTYLPEPKISALPPMRTEEQSQEYEPATVTTPPLDMPAPQQPSAPAMMEGVKAEPIQVQVGDTEQTIHLPQVEFSSSSILGQIIAGKTESQLAPLPIPQSESSVPLEERMPGVHSLNDAGVSYEALPQAPSQDTSTGLSYEVKKEEPLPKMETSKPQLSDESKSILSELLGGKKAYTNKDDGLGLPKKNYE